MNILFTLFPSLSINLTFYILIAHILSVIFITIKIQSLYYTLFFQTSPQNT